MKKFLEEVDKILVEVRQEGKREIESQNSLGLLNKLMKLAQKGGIILRAENQHGKKEKLLVTGKWVFLWHGNQYIYSQIIDLAHGCIKKLANRTGSIGNILRKILAGKVKIEII